MYITITVQISDNAFDISIDAGQKISTAYNVLYESGYINSGKYNWYRSGMRGCLVSAYRTFEEEQIFDGDILVAIEKSER